MTETDSTPEIWKPVVGWEGVYDVSDHGRVRRCHGLYAPNGARLLKPDLGPAGYYKVMLSKRGTKSRWFYVHRLVVEAFIAIIPSGLTVNHLDSVRSNNRVGNLEIATWERQQEHCASMGRQRRAQGSQSAGAKLNEAIVAEIRTRFRRYSKADGACAIAKEFGLHESTVHNLLSRKSWRFVP